MKKVSVPVCLIPVTLCIFLYSQNPEGGKIIPPACPGNIVIEWQEKKQTEKLKGKKPSK